MDQDKEVEKVERNMVQDCLSGETNGEKSRRVQDQHPGNIKPHNPSTEDWCIPADMEEGDYLLMDPACDVNEKGTREKNDGNEVVEEGTSTPLDLDPNEVIEADGETLPYA